MELFNYIVDFLFEWNLCILMFAFYTLLVSVSGLAVHFAGQIPVPDFFLQAYKFGKMAHDARPWKIISMMEVPKRWFFHFYIVASVVITMAALQMWSIYVMGNPLSHWTSFILDFLTVQHRKSSVSVTAAGISLLLLMLHLYRRLYESLCVSVFSSSHMNIIHYIFGHTHYIGTIALMVSEAPGFDNSLDIVVTALQVHHVVGLVLYIIGSSMQHQSFRILAGLRKNSREDLKHEHKMPEGGMFEYLSCPHMFAELLVYTGILIVLQGHTGWLVVTIWVISNQIQVALMNHSWYISTFKDYPKHRRAILPFVL
ncbi:polyprenol reductase-like [Macrobrachium nipponense]|uniref:polyprenol reductase-like n=1 Tax=Macrobrachium nipponense TaxID=159736 RepID=UPI0030C7C7FC